MSYCNTCPTFRNLPLCLETLTIGTFTGNNNALVFVYLKNWTTGYIHRYESQLSGSSVLNLDVTDNGNFHPTPEHDYELYVVLQSATNIDERLTFTVNAVNYTCARFQFVPVMTYNMDMALYSSQTLKLKS